MQTCDHLSQLMSQVLQTPILLILILQSQILSMFTLSSEESRCCAATGKAVTGLLSVQRTFWRKMILREAFTVQPRLASSSWWSLCFSLFCHYIYISRLSCFSLYIFLPFKFFKIIAYRIQGKREFESQD